MLSSTLNIYPEGNTVYTIQYFYVHVYTQCTVEDIKKLTFRNRFMIVLRLHSLQITVAIVLKNDADRLH